ncbi:hypothetical protein FFZ96_07940 [Leptospira borgpetersenii]|nr:Hypothetical protein LBJ_2534 [Leptospira borgpetersenii serovar Hardjo-bovis str. JB197]AMX72231.1 hypothetical protein LBHB_13640 [Leptospira borgpetersenii serovar Hardjo]TQE57082.1 hypothetical protein FFZ96_07940 [Leptospira borgpetersenii]
MFFFIEFDRNECRIKKPKSFLFYNFFMKHDITSLSEKTFQSLQFLCESSECEIFLKEWMSRIFDFVTTEKYDSIKLPWKFDPSQTIEIRIYHNKSETPIELFQRSQVGNGFIYIRSIVLNEEITVQAELFNMIH